MSETIEFEINKQFGNYLVLIKTMSKDREKCFYRAYGKNALVLGYVMKATIQYRNFKITKTFQKLHYLEKTEKAKPKMQHVFTAYSNVPSYRLQEIVSVLDYYHINYIMVDKMQNYSITSIQHFKDNRYEHYYQKGLYYKRILYKIKNINRFLRAISDNGEILYLIYDIERCIKDYQKNFKLKNKK